jgi:hypothetical protein
VLVTFQGVQWLAVVGEADEHVAVPHGAAGPQAWRPFQDR